VIWRMYPMPRGFAVGGDDKPRSWVEMDAFRE
jgi:hypothetical protein